MAVTDPTLVRLTAEVDRAVAALRAYVGGAPAGPEPQPDLVSLKDAQAEFRKSNRQLRRWAKEEDLGRLVEGQWYLSRSLVLQHKNVQACLATMSK